MARSTRSPRRGWSTSLGHAAPRRPELIRAGLYAPRMDVSRALEQHIAVFGEGGSGKTVLLSSFYGATQEPQYLKTSLFNVVADDLGQGNRLHKNYLGMKNSAQVPAGTKFAGT